tara:strand:- start:368 stop:1432 length:1065 start_codon:yes stop_codon:yes gene_type:complete
MNIVFRVDSSSKVGSGHLVRCIHLAKELKKRGAEIFFISRNCHGNVNDLIKNDFRLIQLSNNLDSSHRSQHKDAINTIKKIKDLDVKLLIVDNYCLSSSWEIEVHKFCKNIMVIDDLADRKHYCDFLLDQNFYKNLDHRYNSLMLKPCIKFLGPKYALLKKDFSLQRKKLKINKSNISKHKRYFLFFGGNDFENLTEMTFNVFCTELLKKEKLDIVVGSRYKYIKRLSNKVMKRPKTSLYVQTENMAKIMSKADYSICSGGVNTWERICLNIDSHVIISAENQRQHILGLEKLGVLKVIGYAESINENIIFDHINNKIINNKIKRSQLNKSFCDGEGVDRVVSTIMRSIKKCQK